MNSYSTTTGFKQCNLCKKRGYIYFHLTNTIKEEITTCRDQVFAVFESPLGHLPGMLLAIFLYYQIQHGIQLPHYRLKIIADVSRNFSDREKT